MSRISKWLLPLTLVASALPSFSFAQQNDPNPAPGLRLGDVVVTGFSGTLPLDASKPRPAGKSAVDLTFIDPNGTSATILDLGRPGRAWDASLLNPPRKLKIKAEQIGQVFGIAIGEPPRPNTSPNIYLGATAAYGLQIVKRGTKDAAERLKAGAPGAQWANGQFGVGLQGGPGSIYVVDGGTGAVNLLTNVMLDGVPNPGPGLGNLAYDSAHKQIFVSDLYTGMIHRIGLDGADLGRHDHGATARTAAQLPAVAFDARARLNITSTKFQVDNSDTWGLAPVARRVWAVSVHQDRLYYSVQEGPQIWSVGLQQDGSFAADARLEANVPTQPGPYPVTDIAFSPKGAMLVAQRAAFGSGNYNYSAFTRPGEPRVLRFAMRKPSDPPAPGLWLPEPAEVAVGFAGTLRNANGGLTFGYGYDQHNVLDLGACAASLLTTGEKLRLDPTQRERLNPGGALGVDGVQITPAGAVRDAVNPQPWASIFVDYDEAFEDTNSAGRLGSVRAYVAPCPAGASVVAAASPVPAAPPVNVTPPPPNVTDNACVGANCAPCEFGRYPDGACRPPPIDLAIKKTAGEAKFDPATLTWTVQFTLTVTNTGIPFTPGNTIAVNDPVPTGLTFVSATGAGWTCTGAINCGYAFGPGVFATGASLAPLVVTFTTKTPGKYENCARVGVPQNSGFEEVTLANNKDCASVEFHYPPNNVTVEKIAPREACAVTDPCTFQFKVTNNSPWPFSGPVTIGDTSSITMPITSTDLPCNPQPTSIPFSCAANISLPAGPSSQTFTVTGVIPLGSIPVVNPAETFENCATIANAPPLPGFPSTITTPGKNCTKYVACGFACHMKQSEIDQLKIEKKADSPTCTAGGLCSYTFTISNQTSTPFTGPVSFIDTMPAGASSFVPPPTPAPWTCLPYNGSPDQTKCLIRPANIPANGSISVTVTFMIAPGYQQSTLKNCSEFFVGSNPATLRTSNYGAKDAEALKNYLKMRAANAPEASQSPDTAKAMSALPVLGADDQSCTTVNINQPPQGTNTADVGSLIVKKEIVNLTPATLPALTFPVAVTCNGTVTNLTLVANVPQAVNNIPKNAQCSVVETPPAPINACSVKPATWTTDYLPPGPITVTGTGITVTVRNTLKCDPVTQPKGVMPPIVPIPLLKPDTRPPESQACRAPMVQGPVAGSCVCPRGKEKQGNRCVTPLTCRAPFVENASGSACVCPSGSVRRGGRCIEPVVCRAPMVRTASGMACACPAGLIRRGATCVERNLCNPPARANARGQCVCPPDMLVRGRSCVQRPREREGISPRDVIRVLPGLLNVFPRGGGGGGRPIDGGQGPRGRP